jgi:hypothetical protein
MLTRFLPGRTASLLIGTLSLALLCYAGSALASPAEKVTESTHYSSGGRDQREPVKVSRDTQPPTSVDKRSPLSQSKATAAMAQSLNNDFWFFSADIILFADEDFDGFYSGIDLLFDVDTIYSSADVYAVAYLSFEGGPWEEYVVTDTFRIFGASSGDDYSVVTDLVSGYPPGSYDLLIELFDAFNDEFLAFIGPEDTSELSLLFLEDIAFDTPVGNTTVVINEQGGGGSIGFAVLLPLVALLWRRLRPATRRRLPNGLPRAA